MILLNEQSKWTKQQVVDFERFVNSDPFLQILETYASKLESIVSKMNYNEKHPIRHGGKRF